MKRNSQTGNKVYSKKIFPLYILASFAEDKVSIGSWICLWAFYSVPLIYISVFVPVPYFLDPEGSGREEGGRGDQDGEYM